MVDSQINRQTDRQADRQRDRETERQTDRQRDRETDRLTDRQTDRQKDRQTDRQKDRQRVILWGSNKIKIKLKTLKQLSFFLSNNFPPTQSDRYHLCITSWQIELFLGMAIS